jgi:hypothetical protein
MVAAGRGQEYDVEKAGKGQKSYDQDEEGKILPHRYCFTYLKIILESIAYLP